MSDYLSSVLDELVPTFADEDGDWARVVADAETSTRAAQPSPVGTVAPSAAPRRRHDPGLRGGSGAGGSSPSPSPLS